jgi:hypothetical protein
LDEHTNSEQSDGNDPIADAVQSNGELMEQLLGQFADLRAMLGERLEATERQASLSDPDRQSLEDQILDYQIQLEECEQRIADLEEQNSDLASRVASKNVQQTVASSGSGSGDALTWEERKKLILEQLEGGSFDTESFVNEVGPEDSSEPLDPVAYVRQLNGELASVREELERRDTEIHELRSLLDEQSTTCDGGVAIGAAAIAEMIDADELVQQERERLQLLQEEWEEKFRQGEIEASLERAKLSRERLDLSRKNSELEERLEHIRRENRNGDESGAPSRRWLTKLGLSD